MTKLGIIGLGTMGRNIGLNIKSKGVPVTGFDVSSNARENAANAGLDVKDSLEELANSFNDRKAFWIMVGDTQVDSVLETLEPYLSKGDIIVEAGNSHFLDTKRRVKEAESRGMDYLGTGVSGGEEGALKGPCIMPGGSRKAYEVLKPILEKIAAQAEGSPCVSYMGPKGAGHFVKIVHNGIEYAIMQSIAEVYHVLKKGVSLGEKDIQKFFSETSQDNRLKGYLMEITSKILEKTDPSGKPIVETIEDITGAKGTGKWTVQTAHDLGVAVHSISAALNARSISALKDERIEASNVLYHESVAFSGDTREFLDYAKRALSCAITIAFAQGFKILQAGSKEFNYGLDMGKIASVWRGGCIIRSGLLEPISEAFEADPSLKSILIAPSFSRRLNEDMRGLRAFEKAAIDFGIPTPVISQSRNYFDAYRLRRIEGASLTEAMRDFFGNHGYTPVGKKEKAHMNWG